jgi:ribosomal protein L37AE/L43A
MMAADPPPKPAEPGVDYVCDTCGGNTVTRDARAAWDTDEQDWVLGAAFDYAYAMIARQRRSLSKSTS